MGVLDRVVNIDDMRNAARSRLPGFVFEGMERGNGDGNARNVEALERYRFTARALVDAVQPALSVDLFGRRHAFPMGISSVGLASAFRPRADELLASAAREADVPFILSGAANASVETIARIAGDNAWFQFYGTAKREVTERVIRRAGDAGIKVLVYTVDFPISPRNEVMVRKGVSLARPLGWTGIRRNFLDAVMHLPWALEFLRGGGPQKLDTWVPFAPPGADVGGVLGAYRDLCFHNQTWQELEHARRVWPGKLVIKGIVHPDDAARAVDMGVDAVTVSNHGGIKLECMAPAIDSLAPVVAAVGGRVPVFFDGGIRKGAHVLAALCLGARYCFGGRYTLYGVSAAGQVGVARSLEIMKSDIAFNMAMIGCPSVAELGPQFFAPGCCEAA